MIPEKKFKKYIETIEVDVDSCVSNLRSLDRIIDIFEYHKSNAYDLLMQIEPKSRREALMLVFEPTADSKSQQLAIHANILSAIYNARALYDIFAQLLNKIILKEQFSVNECMLYKVRPMVKEPKLKSMLDSIVKSESYKYINAFVNTIKHRDLVCLGAILDFSNNRGGVKFQSFCYNNETYPSLWGVDVLEHSLNAKNDVIELFNAFEQYTLVKFV